MLEPLVQLNSHQGIDYNFLKLFFTFDETDKDLKAWHFPPP